MLERHALIGLSHEPKNLSGEANKQTKVLSAPANLVAQRRSRRLRRALVFTVFVLKKSTCS